MVTHHHSRRHYSKLEYRTIYGLILRNLIIICIGFWYFEVIEVQVIRKLYHNYCFGFNPDCESDLILKVGRSSVSSVEAQLRCKNITETKSTEEQNAYMMIKLYEFVI